MNKFLYGRHKDKRGFKLAINVVLVEPEIPQNTGNIARTCVVTHSNLHIVGPMGFSLDEKQIRRAGLDYWPYVRMKLFADLYPRLFFGFRKGNGGSGEPDTGGKPG